MLHPHDKELLEMSLIALRTGELVGLNTQLLAHTAAGQF